MLVNYLQNELMHYNDLSIILIIFGSKIAYATAPEYIRLHEEPKMYFFLIILRCSCIFYHTD